MFCLKEPDKPNFHIVMNTCIAKPLLERLKEIISKSAMCDGLAAATLLWQLSTRILVMKRITKIFLFELIKQFCQFKTSTKPSPNSAFYTTCISYKHLVFKQEKWDPKIFLKFNSEISLRNNFCSGPWVSQKAQKLSKNAQEILHSAGDFHEQALWEQSPCSSEWKVGWMHTRTGKSLRRGALQPIRHLPGFKKSPGCPSLQVVISIQYWSCSWQELITNHPHSQLSEV